MEGLGGKTDGVKFHLKGFHLWDSERREEGHQPSGPGLPHWPLDQLERLVTDKLKRGALSPLRNAKYWADPATGQKCRVRGQAISRGNECEVRSAKGFRLHPCRLSQSLVSRVSRAAR
jgi:hypothetical protein